jgi:hypothetical protein
MDTLEHSRLDLIRDRLAKLLQDGLETKWRDRAYTSEAVNAIVSRLQTLPPGDEAGKLRVAGFTLQAYESAEGDISQACETCMYYELHRQFCVLPELQLPVRPEWSCRLWRI